MTITTTGRQLPLAQSVLRVARERLGLSAGFIARACDIDPTGYGRMEKNERLPSPANVDKIWKFYDGQLTIGEIWRPRHPSHRGALTEQRLRKLERWARKHLDD